MKVGVSVITRDRLQMVQELIKSLDRTTFDEFVIVNDSEIAISSEYFPNHPHEMIHTRGSGVGVAKNAALKYLLDKECDYIFVIEDDMKMLRPDVFAAYINASKQTGIQHFLYNAHGPANRGGISGGKSIPRITIEYPSGVRISLFQHCVGAFCMYTRESLEAVGLMDEAFKNVWEHVEHSYRLVKAGYAPAYWWWPDLVNSTDYIVEQACSETSSTIRGNPQWRKNIEDGTKHFISKHGLSPVQIPDKPFSEVRVKLQQFTGL